MRELIDSVLAELIRSDEIEIISEGDETHIAGDLWTLVLEGDPLSSAMIALDDENGAPAGLLREAMSEDAFAAIRDLDQQIGGSLISLLQKSRDPLAQSLAEILAG